MADQTVTTTDAGAAPTPLATVRVGRFELGGFLGAGAMGTVYRGQVEGKPEEEVAIKVVPETSSHLRALKREFRVMSQFRHPNVVRLYELSSAEPNWYLVMELIEGEDFVSRVSRGDPCLQALLGQLVEGVAALHRAGRVHRDIKPTNILVESATDRVVILDFGLSHRRDATRLRPKNTWGTPRYLAPELHAGEAPTPASDWYGVGAVLWESLLQRRPLASDTDAMRLALSEDPNLPQLLRELCFDLLDPDPTRRPSEEDLRRRLGLAERTPGLVGSVVVGRDDELRRCQTVWRQARDGTPSVLWITGASGVGKKSLADRFAREVESEDEGWVLRSRCFATERIPHRALDGIIDHLGALCEDNLTVLTKTLELEDLHLAARLFTSLRTFEGFGDTTVAAVSQDLRTRAISAIARVLVALSHIRPLLLCIDNVQWGDQDSAQLLAALFTRANGARILLACTTRSGPPAAFESTLAFVAGNAEMWTDRCLVELAPLAVESAADLLIQLTGETLALEQARNVARVIGGNPGRLRQAAHWILSGGDPAVLEPSALSRESIGAVDQDYHALLTLLAISERPLAIQTMLAAASMQREPSRIIADLVAADVATVGANLAAGYPVNPGQDRLYLSRDDLRAPILAGVDADARQTLHHSLADALVQRGDTPPAYLATHYHAGGQLDTAAVWATKAGNEASEALAFNAAASQYRDALAWGTGSPLERSVLHEALGNALFDGGRCSQAAVAFEDAVPHAAEGKRETLTLRQMNAWFSSGHLDNAFKCAAPLMKQHGLKLPKGLALTAGIGWQLLRLRFSSDVKRILSEGVPLASATVRDARSELAWVLGNGTSMFFSQQGIYFLLISLPSSLRPGSDPIEIARALALLGGIATNLGPLFEKWGKACLATATQIAAESNDNALDGWVGVWRSNVALVTGEWDSAIAFGDDAARRLDLVPSGTTWECNTAHCFTTMALERQGKIGELEVRAAALVREGRARGDLYGQVLFSLSLGFCRLLAGDVERARTLANEAAAAWTDSGYTLQHFYILRLLCYCDLYEGKRSTAQRRLNEEWSTVRSSDVFVVPSAKLDAFLLWTHVFAGDQAVNVAKLPGPEAEAHGRFVQAWVAHDRAKSATAADSFSALGMRLWECLARSYASPDSDKAVEGAERLGVLPSTVSEARRGIIERGI